MAAEEGFLIPKDFVSPFFGTCDRERTHNYPSVAIQSTDERIARKTQLFEVSCLLGDLGSGEVGRAALLEYVPRSISTIYDIAAIGWPIFGSKTVSVDVEATVRGVTSTVTYEWDYDTSAADVAKILKVPENDVGLGTVKFVVDGSEQVARTGRWRVRYAADPPKILANDTNNPYLCTQVRLEPFFPLASRKTIEVLPCMPLPIDTPLRSGAQVVVQRFNKFWGITAAEARYWNTGTHLPG